MSKFLKLLRSGAVRAVVPVALIVIIGCVFNADGAFFRWATHRDMLRQSSVFGILACGMTIVILAGGIDLSVGSVLGLTGMTFTYLMIERGWGGAPAALMTLVTGIACGVISGAVIARFGVQPFIATLAMMVFARGAAKMTNEGRKIPATIVLEDGTVEYPAIFELIDSRVAGGNVAIVTLVFFGCIAVTWLIMSRTILGRYVMAVGGNEQAALFSGVSVGRVKILAYALCGMFAAIAGICSAAQEFQGDPEAGATYELTAIAIVVIGGTSLAGGKGAIGLTLLGTLTIGYLDKILSLNAVGEAARLMLTGTIIVGAVVFQRARD